MANNSTFENASVQTTVQTTHTNTPTTIEAYDIILISVYFILQVLSSSLNMMSVFAIWKSRSLRQHFNNILFCCLFISHIFTSIMYLVTGTYITLNSRLSLFRHSSLLFIRDFWYALAVSYTVLLSFDRCLSVRFPYFYHNLTEKYCICCISIPVVLNIVFTVWRWFSTGAYLFLMVWIILGILIVNSANLLLYNSVKRQCREIAATIVVSDTSSQQQQQQRQTTRERSLKSLKLCICVASSLIMIVVPASVFLLLRRLDTSNSQIYLLSSSSIIVQTLASSNSLCDVLTFLHFNSEAKNLVVRFLKIGNRDRVAPL